MKIKLEWKQNGHVIQKTVGINQILDLGRSSACSIQLDDAKIALRQAILYVYEGELFVQNLCPNRPIFVDRTVMLGKGDAVPLQQGAAFCMGDLTICAHVTTETQAVSEWAWGRFTAAFRTPHHQSYAYAS